MMNKNWHVCALNSTHPPRPPIPARKWAGFTECKVREMIIMDFSHSANGPRARKFFNNLLCAVDRSFGRSLGNNVDFIFGSAPVQRGAT